MPYVRIDGSTLDASYDDWVCVKIRNLLEVSVIDRKPNQTAGRYSRYQSHVSKLYSTNKTKHKTKHWSEALNFLCWKSHCECCKKKPSNFNRPAFPNIQVRVTPLTEKKGKKNWREKNQWTHRSAPKTTISQGPHEKRKRLNIIRHRTNSKRLLKKIYHSSNIPMRKQQNICLKNDPI